MNVEASDREWRILRHSGRDHDDWREIWHGADERQARGRFQAMEGALRQGGLRLFRGDEKMEGIWAPRLRTRW